MATITMPRVVDGLLSVRGEVNSIVQTTTPGGTETQIYLDGRMGEGIKDLVFPAATGLRRGDQIRAIGSATTDNGQYKTLYAHEVMRMEGPNLNTIAERYSARR